MERESVKTRDARADQRKRREDVLARQKLRRASALNASRGLEAASTDDEAMGTAAAPVPPTAAPAESMETDAAATAASPRRARASAADALMTAEWAVDVPPDLASCWYVAARPAGRRCLVVASGGITRAHARSGRPRSFPSCLPNGSRATRAGLCECELDCIFVEEEQTYYVLDVLNWRGQRLVDCPSDFRLYWLHTKLGETHAAHASSTNPCRFLPLPYAECTPDALRGAYEGGASLGSAPSQARAADAMGGSAAALGGSATLDGTAAMDADEAASAPGGGGGRDGLLLLHRQALYEAGPSPLLLSWSDASCSRRFYDYGSEQMAGALAADPSKAAKWRTHELDAAVSFAEMLRCVETPPMVDVG
jgi:hypothetical protein